MVFKKLRFSINSKILYGKNLREIPFLHYLKLPKDKELFLKVQSLQFARLPKLNLNDYIIDSVDFSCVKFNKHTILPKDLNFMQKIKNKDLSYCIMPIGDYSKYNFNGVILYKTKFPEGCRLPSDYNFFMSLNSKSFLTDEHMPKYMVGKIHLYKLNSIINIYECLLTINQKIYMKLKYQDYYKNFIYKEKSISSPLALDEITSIIFYILLISSLICSFCTYVFMNK